MNISTKLNLAGLKHSVRKFKSQSGELECLVIPIEANNLYKGEKGIYLGLTGFEIKNKVNDSRTLTWLSRACLKRFTKIKPKKKNELCLFWVAIYFGSVLL